MRSFKSLSIAFLLWASCAAAAPQHDIHPRTQSQPEHAIDALVIQTTSGIVHGAINESTPQVRHFLGVPFAQQPLGTLRFRRPQPLAANASTRHLDATSFGPNCPQYESTTPSIYSKHIREFFIWGPTDDACLTVSIWTPLNANNSSNLPVFLWLYGGGHTTGGSTVPYQNPQKWVQRTQSHIVVSIQYRLNFFGSPNGPEPGQDESLYFWDTRAAMEWARTNIAAFGGDPARMVLWGQSAGALNTGQQSLTFQDDPIVSGYIQESGGPYGGINTPYTDTTHANWTYIAEAFGCTGNQSAVLACLELVPSADIEAFQQYRGDSGQTPAFAFQWKGDNVTTFNNGTLAYLSGHYSKLPKILAHALMDGASLAALPPIYPYTTPPNASLELASTLNVRCHVVGEARMRESLNLTSYRMMYAGNFSNISPLPWMGAYHSSELPLIFGTYGDFRGNGTDFQRATSEAMQDMYLAFALDPEEGLARMGWPKYSSGRIEVFGNGNMNGSAVAAYSEDKGIIEDACDSYTLPL